MKCQCGCGMEVPAMSAFNNLRSEFVGYQETEQPGVKLRLYNIIGDHRLDKSTVTVDTLVTEHVPITDMTEQEILDEVEKVRKYLSEAE